ncbi:TetR family transcriptional regulator [Nonomuraea sp. K274]|uniref:TetR family transcriptional regulator n=1 Tax=Nonomuraea cypriaca TaxID=1187855 RepID=A0A931F4I3_9ACTN|nr:TetR family transcriptional regulator [Nonomuraea cypriaca]MBF8193700.1 TetR family transcriptional regulator [Nonomuraea cypriaca]
MRAVAARAGVGASTLRHHFRTQHELVDAVLESIYRTAMPDQRIGDASVRADVRLTECLSSLLTPIGSPEQAREMWRQLFRTYVDSGQRAARPGYAALVRHTRNRVESWLTTLEEEGVLPAGDRWLRARYLLIVLDGLAVARALPDTTLAPHDEEVVLRAAASTVLHLPWPQGDTASTRLG